VKKHATFVSSSSLISFLINKDSLSPYIGKMLGRVTEHRVLQSSVYAGLSEGCTELSAFINVGNVLT